jgi:rhodanese-related sulfurtransferase
VRNFTASELKIHLERTDDEPLLLDVREPWEFQICRLEGSELVPMREIPRVVEEQVLDRERKIVVICHHGIRSRQVGLYLEHQGFEDVINLQGGVEAWAREVDPSMPQY